VVLPPMRRDARDGGSTALPGQQVVGNVNTVPNIVTPLFVTGTGRSARLGQIADPSAVAAAGGRKAPGVVDLPGTLFGSSTPDAATTSTTTSGAKDSVGASKSAVETSQSKKAESGKPATKTSGAGKGTTGDGGPASTVSTSAETTTPARGTTTKATATEPPETTSKAQEPTKTVTPPVISVPVITAPPTTVAPTTVAPTTAAPETTTTARVKPGAGSSGGTDLCVPGTRHCLKN
ncbi:hypothetical protein P0W76_21270, partial [Tsukamurella sp. 8J]|nr:hypothetical protein [Tsukamurella sp. 8J]